MLIFQGKSNNVPFEIKLALLLTIFWITYTPYSIESLLTYNLGFPTIRYQKFFFVVIPFGIMLYHAMRMKRILLPHLFIFSLTLLCFLFIELYHSSKYGGPELNLFFIWIWIYFFFIVITNLAININDLSFIIDYFVVATLITSVILISASYGIINFPLAYTDVEAESGRLFGELNLNMFAENNAIAFTLILLSLLLPEYSQRIKKNRIIVITILLFILPILTATRSALLIMFISLISYILYKLKQRNIFQKLIFSIVLFVIIFYVNETILSIVEPLLISRRFQEMFASESGRVLQILASWYNFLQNPLLGIGYKWAATGYYHGITRSNFQYTQVLASSGILFFLLYVYFFIKIIVQKLSNINNPVILFALIFILIQSSANRPDNPLALLMLLCLRQNQNTSFLASRSEQ